MYYKWFYRGSTLKRKSKMVYITSMQISTSFQQNLFLFARFISEKTNTKMLCNLIIDETKYVPVRNENHRIMLLLQIIRSDSIKIFAMYSDVLDSLYILANRAEVKMNIP
jgi:hypothetical protein